MTIGPPFPLPPQPAPTLRRGTLPPVPGSGQPDVSIVIVHRNAPWQMLEACLAAVEQERRGMQAQVILVDQKPSPVRTATLQARFSWLELRLDRSDRGYAHSNNVGLQRATGRYLLLLNDDVVLESGSLQTLLVWMDCHPRAGYAGPRLVQPGGQLDPACRRSFPTPAVSMYRLTGLSRLFPESRLLGRYNMTYRPVDQTVLIEAVAGACMLVRRKAAEEVGLLDETYFMYGEDLDWAFRMRAAGWHGWYVADALALHYKRSSSSRRRLRTTYEFHRAMLIFYRRHFAATAPAPVTWLVLTSIMLRGIAAVVRAWHARSTA